MSDIHFFTDRKDFRAWLEKHHKTEKELLVGFYRKSTGKPSIDWPQSVEEALCFGWIDGVRRSIDEESYSIRFTPRKPDSIWSKINIKKMEELIEKERMTEAGLTAYEKRKDHKSGVYSYENEEVKLSGDYENVFKANPDAWKFFESQPPSYRKPASRWVMSAKQEETRQKRLHELIKDSKEGLRIKSLRYGQKK